MKDKRGIELSMNVIVISILVIIVLVILVLIFTGGITTFSQRLKTIFQASGIDLSTAQIRCNGYCQSYATSKITSYARNFCGEKTFDIDLNQDGKITEAEKGKTCSDINIPCEPIREAGGCEQFA